MNKKFLVINGPNLNMLGKREPEIYGSMTLEEIEKWTRDKLESLGQKITHDWFQSNVEGEIVTAIQKANQYSAIIINPGAYSHTSVAILDALRLAGVPVIEVHLSNTAKREEFRQRKITALASNAILEGHGHKGYLLAILSLIF